MLFIEKIKNKSLKDRVIHFFELSKDVRPREIEILAPIERYIDHTLLKPETTQKQIEDLCKVALDYNFYSVCVQPHYVHLASQLLSGTSTLPITVVGFPLGNNTPETKLFEAKNAIENGAQEVDMVLNIAAMKSKDFDFALDDVKKLVENVDTPVKVIIETALLTKEEKIIAAAIVEESDADYIKTSTGFSTSGAQLEDVHLFYHLLEDRVAIKASGGIKNKEQALAFLTAGCERLGTSSGVEILQGVQSNQSY